MTFDNFIYKKLPNGLTICLIPKKGYVQTEAMIAFGCGSTDVCFNNATVPYGTAHFTEHKMFDKRHGNIFNDFGKLGASVNAFTSQDTTAYYFTCIDGFNDCLALLAEVVTEPYFTKHGIEGELGIIGSEVDMYEDDANWLAHFGMLGGLYGEHPLAVPIAGKREDLRSISVDTLKLFYDCFYTAQNAILTIAGDFDTDAVLEMADRLFTLPTHKRAETKLTQPTSAVSTSVKCRKQVATSVYSIGFRDNGLDRSPAVRQITAEILTELVCGRGSVLYERLFNTGLCTAPPYVGYLNGSKWGVSVISGTSQKPENVLSFVCKEVENYLNYGITQRAIERVVAKKTGELEQKCDSLDFCCTFAVDNFVKSIKTLDIPDKYGSINSDELMVRFKECFASEEVCLSQVVGSR